MTLPSPVATPLYDAQLHIDEIIDSGYPLAALASGTPLPPSGVRFDVAFSGTVAGTRLNGSVIGVDYLSVRADGRLDLHLHARVRTDDGASLAFVGTGLASATRGAGPLPLFEHVTLHSTDARYLWVNGYPSGATARSTSHVPSFVFAGSRIRMCWWARSSARRCRLSDAAASGVA